LRITLATSRQSGSGLFKTIERNLYGLSVEQNLFSNNLLLHPEFVHGGLLAAHRRGDPGTTVRQGAAGQVFAALVAGDRCCGRSPSAMVNSMNKMAFMEQKPIMAKLFTVFYQASTVIATAKSRTVFAAVAWLLSIHSSMFIQS
jgi:hypothetical protein